MTSTVNGRRYKCTRRCLMLSGGKRSPRTRRWNIYSVLPAGSGWRSRTIADTGTASSSRNCGSTPSGAHCGPPAFVKDFPVETTPLTRQHRSIPGVTEKKWDLYVRGFELATGYSELVDPIVQRERFEAQARAAAAGDDEAMALDEDFLAAMEYAMPPTTGTGMGGIDRLLMALTGLSIRETVFLFPIVRRHG